ncbi:radical SAM protein [Zhenpiania hominis]|uniref:radical SAM protein n=1 Tax=Zhenpiania hominis TaxID=2763644 RepID=UPI0039F46094
MKVILISWDVEGKILYDLIKQEYQIDYIVERNPDLWRKYNEYEIISFSKALDLYMNNSSYKFIIPCMRGVNVHTEIYMSLLERGVKVYDVLYAPLKIFKERHMSNEDKKELICLFDDRTDLDFLVLHIAEGCNLSCAHCSMFAGLIKSKKNVDFEKTKKGIKKLKKIFDQILVFKVMGGEPFLNNQIVDYCRYIRQTYPLTDIEIVTNGTLLMKQSKETIQALVDLNVTLDISYYSISNDIIDELNEYLNQLNIKHFFTYEIREFFKAYNFEKKNQANEVFKRCKIKFNCVNMKENRLAVCHVPFGMEVAAKEFKIKISQSDYGFIDLDDKTLTARKCINFMNQSHEICKYCSIDSRVIWEEFKPGEEKNVEYWSV